MIKKKGKSLPTKRWWGLSYLAPKTNCKASHKKSWMGCAQPGGDDSHAAGIQHVSYRKKIGSNRYLSSRNLVSYRFSNLTDFHLFFFSMQLFKFSMLLDFSVCVPFKQTQGKVKDVRLMLMGIKILCLSKMVWLSPFLTHPYSDENPTAVF